MRKIFYIFLLTVIGLMGCATYGPVSQKQYQDKGKYKRERRIEQSKRTTIAILDFEAVEVPQAEAVFIGEFLREALLSTKVFKIVNRSNMEKILAEQGFQQTGCTEADCAVQIGKILNVHKIIIGKLGKIAGRYCSSVQLVDVTTGEIIYADSEYFSYGPEAKEKAYKIAERLAYGLLPASAGKKEKTKEEIKDKKKIALMTEHYNKGTEYYQKGEYKKAIKQWEKVLELDPDHEASKEVIKRTMDKIY